MTVINPLDAECPACLVGRGEPCFATSSNDPRVLPHRLRGLAAAEALRRCRTCAGSGWEPADGPEPCPVCRARPGEQCQGTKAAGTLRVPRHRLWEVATARGMRRCSGCKGVGWEPDGDLEVADLTRPEELPPGEWSGSPRDPG